MVKRRRQDRQRQTGSHEGSRKEAVWFASRGALAPAPRPRREDQFHEPEPCSLWGGGGTRKGIGQAAMGTVQPDQWRGLQVGASRPARARQSKAVSVSEPCWCWAGLAVCVTAWGPCSPVPLPLRLPATYRTTRSPHVRAYDISVFRPSRRRRARAAVFAISLRVLAFARSAVLGRAYGQNKVR